MTLEREDPSGAPWCPPGDAVAVRRWVTDRSASLGTGIRRVVRLARIMAIAARARLRLASLHQADHVARVAAVSEVLERAFAEGRIPKTIEDASDTGVHLREAAVTGQVAALGRDFRARFRAMPRLAALLDFLHNALWIQHRCRPHRSCPAARRPRRGGERSLARTAHRSECLAEPAARKRQSHAAGKRIRAFVTTRGRLVPETIDDESIFLFWTARRTQPRMKMSRASALSLGGGRHVALPAGAARRGHERRLENRSDKASKAPTISP